jgi:hypothetical protein
MQLLGGRARLWRGAVNLTPLAQHFHLQCSLLLRLAAFYLSPAPAQSLLFNVVSVSQQTAHSQNFSFTNEPLRWRAVPNIEPASRLLPLTY